MSAYSHSSCAYHVPKVAIFFHYISYCGKYRVLILSLSGKTCQNVQKLEHVTDQILNICKIHRKPVGAEMSQAQASFSTLELFLIRHPSNTLCFFHFLYALQYIVRSSSFLRPSFFEVVFL